MQTFKRPIVVLLFISIYLVTIQGCATFQNYYNPQGTKDPGPAFEPKKRYQIRTVDGKKYDTDGSRINWTYDNVRFLDYKSQKYVTLPIEQISEVRTKKFSAGLTAGIVAGSLAAVGGIIVAIIYAGAKGTAD